MYYIGRIIGAFFNQFFRWLFWNKTGQKILFSILIVVIFFVFIKCGEVAAVEQVEDVNYKVYNYYDSLQNDFVMRLNTSLNNNNQYANEIINYINNGEAFYIGYGISDGSGYNNSYPASKGYLFVIIGNNSNIIANATPTSNDYMGVTGFTQYVSNVRHYIYRFTITGNCEYVSSTVNNFWFPLQLFNRKSQIFVDYLNALNNGNEEEIIEILSNIEESLSNTTPTSETDSFVNVDTSSTDSISSTAVDNVASNVLSNLENKVNNYNPSTDYSFVWTIMGTTITFHSNMIYNLIKNTFLYDLIQMLWFFITGHYCFAFLCNLIHSIKDGSILDGFHPTEVISKEVL